MKASLVLILSSAAGFTQYSGNSARLTCEYISHTGKKKIRSPQIVLVRTHQIKSLYAINLDGIHILITVSKQSVNYCDVLSNPEMIPHVSISNSHFTKKPFRSLLLYVNVSGGCANTITQQSC